MDARENRGGAAIIESNCRDDTRKKQLSRVRERKYFAQLSKNLT